MFFSWQIDELGQPLHLQPHDDLPFFLSLCSVNIMRTTTIKTINPTIIVDIIITSLSIKSSLSLRLYQLY